MDASKAGPAVTRSRSVLRSVPLEKEKRTASRRKGTSIGKGGKQPGDCVAAASNIVSTMETRKKPRVDYNEAAKWEKHLFLYNEETRDNEETDMAVEDSGRKIGGNNDNGAVEMKRKRGAINKQKKGMEKQGEVEAGKKGLEEGLVASANQKKEGGVKMKALRKQKGVNDEESQVSGKNKSQGKKRGGKKSQQDGNQEVDQVEDLSKVKNKQEAEEDSEIIMTFNMLEFKETPLTEGCKKIRELEIRVGQF